MGKKNKIRLFRKLEDTRDFNSKYEISRDELNEYAKCANDVFYFIEKYLQIKLRSYQKSMIENYLKNRFIIQMHSRQIGNRSAMMAVYIWQITFGIKKSIACFHNRRDARHEMYNIIFNYYKKIPYFMKLGIKSITANKKIYFDGNSLIEFRPYTKHLAIGREYDLIDLQDFSSLSNENAKMYTSHLIPLLSSVSSSNFVIGSQPNGFNHFYEVVLNSERKEGDPQKNNFVCERVYWWEVEGRDQKWVDDQIKLIGSKRLFDQEYGLQFSIQ